MKQDDAGYRPTNRESARRSRLGYTYCACDAYLVADGRKCPACGWKNQHGREPARDTRRR